MGWYEASKKGLEKIARRRGLTYVLFELVQNAWDTGAKEVKVTFTPVDGRPLVDVVVEDDDPDGFKNLTHAWTLFAESEKKGDPEKRGKFNLGEKLVLAVCESAEIVSTTGNVRFDEDGEGRHVGRKRTEKGSVFQGRVKMTREELMDVLAAARRLIPPPGVSTTINGEPLHTRPRIKAIECTLATEIANEEGFLVPRQRKTTVNVYAPAIQTEGWLYEMGIPVCQTGDQWDVDIMQKVPVNLERNSVSEAYLRTVRVFLLNELFDQLRPEDAATPAVQAALTDERVKPEAVEVVLTHQYGEKRAIFDPSDQEANRRLVADGYALIPPRAFTKDAWKNIRSSGAALPSGQIRPTPNPYEGGPGSPSAEFIPEDEWTPELRGMAEYCTDLAWKLIRRSIKVRFEKKRMTDSWGANYGSCTLTFNYDRLGKNWFNEPREDVNGLIIHELAHQFESNHLSTEFYHAIQRLGAKLGDFMYVEPEFFKRHGYKPTHHG
jgi:hypothetical protein